MRLPNKIISFKESSLSKFPTILECIQDCDMTPLELYAKIEKCFDSISDYIETLDYLFALNRISLNPDTGRITYVI
ncbi:ABC-three component system middle component 7 [Pelotomaculum propionicicum]|uniref:ABC-three component system middle component 7 n=1 Tax=Pelotomaculum propionicicum TaxID=258475 RepID=UPI003B80F067